MNFDHDEVARIIREHDKKLAEQKSQESERRRFELRKQYADWQRKQGWGPGVA